MFEPGQTWQKGRVVRVIRKVTYGNGVTHTGRVTYWTNLVILGRSVHDKPDMSAFCSFGAWIHWMKGAECIRYPELTVSVNRGTVSEQHQGQS